MRSNTPETFWERVAVCDADACWLWVGALNQSGYGTIRWTGKVWLVHRLAYFLANGYVDDCVCHSCDVRYPAGDQTHRKCCNPSHLWLGTRKDNNQDMAMKGRAAVGERNIAVRSPEVMSRPGKENGMAVLVEKDIRSIRKRIEDGETKVAVARDLGISPAAVSLIAARKRWGHVL